MLDGPGRAIGTARRLAAFAVLAVLILSSLPRMASAEIPHENYDIANPDLDVVLNLLNASIRASERALMDFYNQSMTTADQYLDMVSRVLDPAGDILNSIQDLAQSYQNLSYMLPPFQDLLSEMQRFSGMEVTFLQDRDDLIAASHLLNMSDEQRIEALKIVASVNSLVASMNSTIDQMLVSAGSITTMLVGSRTPFAPNQLEPLILKLRDLLNAIMLEIDAIVHNEVPWGEDQAFLVLWIADSELYLGENLAGGGYLYYNRSFAGGEVVRLFIDSRNLVNVTTSPIISTLGTFRFSYPIQMNASMLGHHTIVATAQTPFVNLSSDLLGFDVVLMPTNLSIRVDRTLMSIDESATATLTLKDVYGRAIEGAAVNWTMDLTHVGDTTDVKGEAVRRWAARDLGFGSHSLSAEYVDQLPYASNSSETIAITVSIPTHIELELFADTFASGYFIVGHGYLWANASDRLPGQTITLLLDGGVVLNATTEADGEFSFSISSEGLSGGTHVLKGEFLYRDIIWRYSYGEAAFTIGKPHQGGYPFWPFFPGWQTGPPLEIPYLFFGPYAYYTWLFMILVLGVIIKTFQIRRRKVTEASKNPLAGAPLPGEAGLGAAGPEAPFSVESFERSLLAGGPNDPNGKIVWYYRGLLEFLRGKRRLPIEDSMTHWEVARLLSTLGYPKEGVLRVTVLFERAFYSGKPMSEDDAVGMSAAMSGLMIPKGGAPAAS